MNKSKKKEESARRRRRRRICHDNNVTLVLIIVVIVFSVCQFPALVTQLSWNFLPDAARHCGGFQFYFSRVSNALVVTNSAVNCAIYIRFNKRFRSILAQMVFGSDASTVGKRHPLLTGRPAGDTSGGTAAGGRGGPTTGGPAMAMPSPSSSTLGALQQRTNPAGEHRLSTLSTITGVSRMKSTDQSDDACSTAL